MPEAEAEDIAMDIKDARQESFAFGLVQCSALNPQREVLHLIDISGCHTQLQLISRSDEPEEGFAALGHIDHMGGYSGKSATLDFVFGIIDSRHPLTDEAKAQVQAFVKSAMQGNEQVQDAYNTVVDYVAHAVREGSMSAYVGEIVLEIVEGCVDEGSVYLAVAINSLNRGELDKHDELRLQLLQVFVDVLF